MHNNFSLITAIGNPEKEAHIAHLLHSQSWKIAFRALDGNFLENFLRENVNLPEHVLVYSQDFPLWNDSFLSQANEKSLLAICIDEIQFTSHFIMEHIRAALRGLESEPQITQHLSNSIIDRPAPPQMRLQGASAQLPPAHSRETPPNLNRNARTLNVKTQPLYVFTGGVGAPGISTLCLSTGLAFSDKEQIAFVDLDKDFSSLAYLSDYQVRHNREIWNESRGSTLQNSIRHLDKAKFEVRGFQPKKSSSRDHVRGKAISQGSINRSRKGFSILPHENQSIGALISDSLGESTTFVDLGRLSNLESMVSSKDPWGLQFQDLLATANVVIYCVRAEKKCLHQLSQFMESLHDHRFTWEMFFILNCAEKGKQGRELIDLFHGNIGNYPSHIIFEEHNMGKYFPAKAPLAGTFGKQINELAGVLRY